MGCTDPHATYLRLLKIQAIRVSLYHSFLHFTDSFGRISFYLPLSLLTLYFCEVQCFSQHLFWLCLFSRNIMFTNFIAKFRKCVGVAVFLVNKRVSGCPS